MTYLAFACILAALGIVLLVGEYFFAAHGVLLVASVLCFFGAIGVIAVYGSLLELAVATVMGVIALPVGIYWIILGWKKLFGGEPSPAAEASIAEMPELLSQSELRGRVGKTMSPMRPSGVVEFEGRRVDAISEGLMLDAGIWVKCVDVKPGRIIVRQVEVDESKPVVFTMPSDAVAPKIEPAKPKEEKKIDLNNDDWQIN